MVDKSLLVIRAGQTPHASVERAVDALGRDHIIGVVLNAVESRLRRGRRLLLRAGLRRAGRARRAAGPGGLGMQALLGGITWRRSSLVLMDHILILAAVVLAVAVRMGPTHELLGWPLIWRAILIAGVLQVCLHYRDLYDLRRLHDRRRLIVGLLEALGAGCALLALIYYWLPDLVIGRGIFLVGAAFIVLLRRPAGGSPSSGCPSRMGPHERVLIVGTSVAASELAREIYERRHQLGVEFTGFVEVPRRRAARSGPGRDHPRQHARHPGHRPRSRASIASSSASPTHAARSRWTSCCT